MDGVIVDSNPMHREAWVAYNRLHGIQTTEEMQLRMYGRRNDELVRDFYGSHLTDEEVASHGAAKEQLYRDMIRPNLLQSLVPGIREFVSRRRRSLMALATNAEPKNVEFILNAIDLAPFFRVVIDGQQVNRPKPDPEIYLLAAKLLDASPRQCVVFEDSYPGVEAGIAAGMAVVGVRTTHRDLPGTAFSVENFLDPDLDRLLEELDRNSCR